MNKKYFVYILECADKTLYTGIAIDIKKRLFEHNSDGGKGAKYTRSRQPTKLVWKMEIENKSKALKEEYRIKQLTKKEKENLIKNTK